MGIVWASRNVVMRAWQARSSLLLLVERDLRARYVGSLGGVFWAVFHPLLLVATYSLVFSLIFGRRMGDAPFAVWLFCGLLPWMAFAESVKGSATVLRAHRNLVQKAGFAPELLPLVVVGSALVNHLLGIGVLLAVFLLYRQPISSMVWTLPFYTALLLLFTLGLSWLVAALNVFLRDVGQVVAVVLNLWFYLCPILYPASIVPEHYQGLYQLNPMVFLTEGYRQALLGGAQMQASQLAYFLGWTCLVLGIGGTVFRRLKVHIAEVL